MFSNDFFSGTTLPSANPVKFNPYSDNGGTVVAIAGQDFVVIGADTRLSTGFSIFTRRQKKLFKLSEKTVLGSIGCWCDILTFQTLVRSRMKMYEYEHNKTMPIPAVSQMLSIMLYYKRFFPYCVGNVLAGLDAEGKGCVYNYDLVGHCERTTYRASGSAGAQLQPLLDSQISLMNTQNVQITKEKALSILKDAFVCAAERDISTGDDIYILIVNDRGIEEQMFGLRND